MVRVKLTDVLSAPPTESSAALWDVGQVAVVLRCSRRHIYRMSDAGRMPRPRKLNSLVRWSREEIERWIEQGCPDVRQTKKGGTR